MHIMPKYYKLDLNVFSAIDSSIDRFWKTWHVAILESIAKKIRRVCVTIANAICKRRAIRAFSWNLRKQGCQTSHWVKLMATLSVTRSTVALNSKFTAVSLSMS